MEDLLPFIIFIGWVIYNVISVAASGKKNKRKRQVPGQPQQRPAQQSQPANRKQPQSIEDVFKRILEQQGQRPAENQAPKSHPREKSKPIHEEYPHAKVESLEKIPKKKVFSYEDEYETEKYDKQKIKRSEHIRQTRLNKKHLQSSIHDANLKLKKKKKKRKSFINKGFKFNAKDAVIYSMILNRKYK